MADLADKRKFYIDGAWVAPATPNDLEVIDPTTEEPVAVISVGAQADTDRARPGDQPGDGRGRAQFVPRRDGAPDQQTRGHRADERAHAADHGDHEGLCQDERAHFGINVAHRRGEHAAQRRQPDAEPEDEQPAPPGDDADKAAGGELEGGAQ